MNVIRLRSDIDAGTAADKSSGMDPETAPLRSDDQAAGAPIDPQLADDVRGGNMRSSRLETVGRWFARGVALTLALFLGVWLLK